MKELLEILDRIAVGIGGEWKNQVLIDNTTDNDLVDAYNEGVHAMARQACYYVSVILASKAAEMRLEKVGDR